MENAENKEKEDVQVTKGADDNVAENGNGADMLSDTNAAKNASKAFKWTPID